MSSKTHIDIPPGTFELLILKTLSLEPLHGLGISNRLEQITAGAFRVNPGSFFPVLHRLEEEGWIDGEWGRSENNRRARFYSLTAAGRRKLARQERQWRRASAAVSAVLETAPGV